MTASAPSADLHDRALRDPHAVVFGSIASAPWHPGMLDMVVEGRFWEHLEELALTLLVTREYEHLVIALSCGPTGPHMSALRLPHPSGLAVDRSRGAVYVACTRNPNQVVELAPAAGALDRSDREGGADACGLVPVSARYFPGAFYLHDLAFVGGSLLGNAVGLNAVVDLTGPAPRPVWWPASIDGATGPDLSRNVLQLNSIAAGSALSDSFFSASTASAGDRIPGDPNWYVDRQGVIFAGRDREVVATGLTRPHSARLAPGGELYVDDSGYGRLCVIVDGRPEAVVTLDGWTRGLCFLGATHAVVGVSRVIPRFAGYAPGLDPSTSRSGLRLVDLGSGRVVGSLTWPAGNQVFAIDWLPSAIASGFLTGDPTLPAAEIEALWYRYAPPGSTMGRSPLRRRPDG